jgi:INO80 complex subunit B
MATPTGPSKKPPLTIKIDLKRIKEQSEATDSVDSLASDEDVSVGDEEDGSLRIDWEGENSNSMDIDIIQQDDNDEEVDVDANESEEEQWLVALEKGEVDNRGYLPSKDKKENLTARQKALLDGADTGLMELPMFSRKKPETEEMLLKKSERNRKRKLRAAQRREEVKAETIQRLLQKQPVKKKEEEKVMQRTAGPYIRYSNGVKGIALLYPEGVSYPLEQKKLPVVPTPQYCCVKGCSQLKKYSHSKSHLPLCSLECYRKVHQSSSSSLKNVVKSKYLSTIKTI